MWVDSTSLGFARYMSGVSFSNEIIVSEVAGLKNISMHASTWKTFVISLKNDCILPEEKQTCCQLF